MTYGSQASREVGMRWVGEKTSVRDDMNWTDRTCVVLRTKSSAPVAGASGFRLMTGGRGGVKQETDSLNLQSWA